MLKNYYLFSTCFGCCINMDVLENWNSNFQTLVSFLDLLKFFRNLICVASYFEKFRSHRIFFFMYVFKVKDRLDGFVTSYFPNHEIDLSVLSLENLMKWNLLLFILFRIWLVLLNIMKIFLFAIQSPDRHHDIETSNLTQCFECIFLILYVHLGCFYSSVWFRSSSEDLVFGFHRIHQLISSQVWVAACNWNHSPYLSRPLPFSVYIFSGMISYFYFLLCVANENITYPHFTQISIFSQYWLILRITSE